MDLAGMLSTHPLVSASQLGSLDKIQYTVGDVKFGLAVDRSQLAGSTEDMDRGGIGAEYVTRDIVGNNKIQILSRQLVSGAGQKIFCLRGEADQELITFCSS